jgi:hypothetical protein
MMLRFTSLRRALAVAVAATLGACNASPTVDGTTPNADFDSISVPAPSCADGWRVTLVPHQGSDPQWAVGADGKLHIMFIGYGNDTMALRHVAEDAPATATTVGGMGLGSLAIAPDGTPNAFLAARSGTVQEPDAVGIVHVAHAHSGWMLDPTEVSQDGGMVNASAIDGDGHAHLAYGDGGLFYMTDAGGTWQRTAVGTRQQVGVWGLQLDRGGHVHIWFESLSDDGMTLANFWASNASGDWKVVPLPASDVATAIDSRGFPHVVTGGTGKPFGLSHLWWDGTAWQTEALSALGNVTLYDMRLDGNDKMHLLLETENSNIVYANDVAGTWKLDRVVSFTTKGQVVKARLGLGPNNEPHVAFTTEDAGATFGFAQHCN